MDKKEDRSYNDLTMNNITKIRTFTKYPIICCGENPLTHLIC